MGAINSLKQMISDVNDLNTAITNLRLVMGGTEQSFNGMIGSAKNMAVNLSANTQDILTAAQTYANAYTSADTVLNRVKSAVVLSNIGSIPITEAVNAVHAAAVSYKLDADQTMQVVDKMSKVASTSTVSYSQSLENLTQSFELFSSIAKNTGKISMDELLALSQTAQDTTRLQSGVVNNGLRQILVRTYRVKDPTGEVDLNGSTNAQVQLKKIGVDVVDGQTGKLKAFNTILLETAKALKHTTEAQAELVKESLAGGRQVQIIDALLNNVDEYSRKVKASSESAGYGMKMQGIYAESSEAKIKKLQSTLYNLYTQSMNSSTIKTFLNLGEGVLTVIEKLSSSTVGFAGVFGVLTARLISTKIATLGFTSGLKGIGGTFADLGKTILGMNTKLDDNTVKLRANKAVQAEYQASLIGGIDSTKYMKQAEENMLATTNVSGLTKKVQALEAVNSMEQQGIITSERSVAMKESLNAMTNEEVASLDRKTIALKLASEAEISNGTASKILREETVALNTQEKLRETQSYKNIVAIDAEADATKAAGIATIGFSESIKALGMSVAIMAGIQLAFEGIMWIVDSFKKASEAEENERKTVENNIKAHTKSTESLETLKNKYEELSNKTNKTTAENKEFTKVQNDLAKLLPSTTSYIDAQGNAHIKNTQAIEKEIEKQKELNQAKLNESAIKSEKNISKNLNKVDENEGRIKDLEYISKNRFKSANGGYAIDTENNMASLNDRTFSMAYINSSNQHIQDLILSMRDLNSQYLAENNKLKAGLLENQDIYQNYSNSMKNTVSSIVQNTNQLNNSKQVNTFLGNLDRAFKSFNISKLQDEVTNKVKNIIDNKTYNEAQNSADKLANAMEQALTSALTKKFHNSKNKAQIQEMVNEMMSNISIPKIDLGDIFVDDFSNIKKNMTDVLDTTQTKVKDLSKALVDLNSGDGLTSDSILELTEKYNGFEKCLTITKDGVEINKTALENLRNTAIDVAKKQLETEKTKTENVLKQTQARLAIMDIESKGLDILASKTDAQVKKDAEVQAKVNKNKVYNSEVTRLNTKMTKDPTFYESMSKQYNIKDKNKLINKMANLTAQNSYIDTRDAYIENPEEIKKAASDAYDKAYEDSWNKTVGKKMDTRIKLAKEAGLKASKATEATAEAYVKAQKNVKATNDEIKTLMALLNSPDFGADSSKGLKKEKGETGSTTPSTDRTVSNDYASPSSKALTADIDKQITNTKNEIEKQKNRESQLYLWSKKQVEDYYNNRRKLENDLIKENEAKKNKLIQEQNRVNNEFKNPKSALMTYFEKNFGIKDPVKSYENGKMQQILTAKDKSDSTYMNGLQKKIDDLSGKTDKNSKALIKKYKEMINERKAQVTKRKKEYDQFAKDYEIKGTIGTDITSVDSDLISSKQEKANINTEQINNYIESKDKSLAPLDNKESQMKSNLDLVKSQKITLSGLNEQITLNKQLQAIENQRANISTKYADDLRKKAIGLGATLDKNKNIVMTSVPTENRDAVQAIVNKVNELKQSWFDSKNAANGYADEIKNINEQKLQIASDTEKTIEDMIKKSKDLQEKELDKDLSKFKKVQDQKIKKLDELYNKQKQIDEMNDKDKEINKKQSELDIISGDNSDWANSKRKELQDDLDKLMSEKNEKLAENSYNKQKNDLEDLTTKMENDTQAKKDALDEKYSDENVKKIAEIAVAKGQILTEDIKYLNTETKKINEQYVDLKSAFINYESTFGDGLTMLSDKTTDFVNNLKVAQQAIIDLDKDMKNTINSNKSKNVPNIKTQQEAEAYAKQQKQTTSTPKTNSNSKNTVKPTTPTTKTNSVGNLLKNATNIGIPKNILNLIPQGVIDNINESLQHTSANMGILTPQVNTSIPNVQNINNSKSISVVNHVNVTIPNTGDINKNTQNAAKKTFEGVLGGLKGVLGGNLGL